MLSVQEPLVYTAPLQLTGHNWIVERVEASTWIGDEDRSTITCVCPYCGHVFCEGYPESLEEFEAACRKEEDNG